MDSTLLHWLYGGSPAWVAVMAAATVIGSGWSIVPIALLAAFDRTRPWTLRLLTVLTVVAAAVYSLKALIGRVRPCAAVPGIHALVLGAPSDPSCPSGHAAGAFAFAVFFALETRAHAAFKLATLALATGIAVSRVALGVHFPSDAAAGALLGTAVSAGASALLTRRRARRG